LDIRFLSSSDERPQQRHEGQGVSKALRLFVRGSAHGGIVERGGSRAVYVSGPLAVTLCMNVAGRGVTVDTDRDDPPVAGQVLKELWPEVGDGVTG
jgi:hypothetical protein